MNPIYCHTTPQQSRRYRLLLSALLRATVEGGTWAQVSPKRILLLRNTFGSSHKCCIEIYRIKNGISTHTATVYQP